MSKNKKDKNLNEKEIEKVSGGKQAGGCLLDPTFRPQLLEYGGPMICKYGGPKLTPAIAYGGPQLSPVKIESLKKIQQKKKTSSPNEVKNLQPFSDEDKN